MRCSRFEKPVRSKKNRKTGFYRGHNYQYHVAELEASIMAEFVANPKGKAPIWEFFRFRCKDGQVDRTRAYCTECKASVKLGDGTLNMSAHVRRHHPLLLNKPFGKAKVTSVRNPPGLAPIDSTGAGPSASTDSDVDPLTNLKTSDAALKHKKQMTLGEALKKKETYPPNSNRASDINEKIGRFIVKDLQPFKVVETESFKEVLRILDPKYNVPGIRFFTETLIPKMYNDTKEQLRSSLSLSLSHSKCLRGV